MENGETIVSLQSIDAKGFKLFTLGGKKKGCYFVIGELGDTIVICEGYATGATVYEATGLPVVVAFDSGNLAPVSKIIRKKYPTAHIIFAADDDCETEKTRGNNTGIKDARKAADAVNGIVAIPPFNRDKDGDKPSDWNDYAELYGKEAVGNSFKSILQTPSPEDTKQCPTDIDAIIKQTLESIENERDEFARDQAIIGALDKLHLATEKFAKESREYKAIKDSAIALFAKLSGDYRGNPDYQKQFRLDWGMDYRTLLARLKEHDEKRLREEVARQKEKGSSDDQQIAKLNKNYCFVIEAGKATVFHEQYDPVLKRKFYAHLRPKDFEYAFGNQFTTVVTANGLREIGFGSFWLRHPKRRQYLGGVIFDPANRLSANQLNLWNGFGVEAKKGSWRKMKKHIFKVVCGRDKVCFKYVMRWMANAVQHPERQGEIVIVLRGGEGVGKGFLGRTMVRLFGRHGLHIRSTKHLTGNFNAHLQDCVMLFADEAFYAGDKKHIGVLNALITEPTQAIEGKGKDVVQGGNFVHLIMASNNDWVVPASLDARRFCVLDVSDDHKDDTQYFEALDGELENGGYEAMLHDLQRMNLQNFNVRDFPKTEALQEQKLLSMKIEQQWLHEVLSQGYVRKSDHGLQELEDWHEIVTTKFLHDAYERFARSHGERRLLSEVYFGQFLHTMGWGDADKTQTKKALAGENRKGFDNPEVIYNRKKHPAYKLGPLADARKKVAKAMGLNLQWPEEGISDENIKASAAEPEYEPPC